MLITDPESKPLVMIWLLEAGPVRGQKGLVFTQSMENANRLEELLAAYLGNSHDVKQYSSEMKPAERKRTRKDLENGKTRLLICSDLIARGMDLPSVQFIISYDAPLDMRKYVHRAGRTARAGREGSAWTLVEKQQVRHFKEMMRESGQLEKVKRVKLTDHDLEQFKASYEVGIPTRGIGT